MEKLKKFTFFAIFILINSFIVSSAKDISDNIINQYYSSIYDNQEITDMDLDTFVTGTIIPSSATSYKVKLNDTEHIFFDFQNELSCLYITIDDNTTDDGHLMNSDSYDFQFCSNGTYNFFILNKTDINEKRHEEEETSIEGLNLIITVANENATFDSDFYALKVSLQKSVINILDIKSSHKMLCKTETINGKNRCLFVFDTNDTELNGKNLIIYSTPYMYQRTEKDFYFYADYINKSVYDQWDTEYLMSNIPNNESLYNNSNNINLLNIQDLNTSYYLYISVESNETILEIIAQTVSLDDNITLPTMNDIKFYSINETSNTNIKDLIEDKGCISMSIITIYGKASIKLGNTQSIEHITDTIENQLIFNLDLDLYHEDGQLIINNLLDNNETEYIFYISYTNKTSNKLKELSFGKSSKLISNDNQYTDFILYQTLPTLVTPLDINIQLYDANFVSYSDVENIDIDIDIIIISKEDLYKLKLDNDNISAFNTTIKSKFNNIYLASNIHLTSEDIVSFGIDDNPYIIIHISNITASSHDIVFGFTISQMNNLMYPSERIYHFGQLNDKNIMVYKLKGKTNYHLMRLEFSAETDKIGWTVKRTNDSENYKHNDTDLSFVTEKWVNGRELLTMYIERGEDIYLTIFKKDIYLTIFKNDDQFEYDNSITNFVFKYISSVKNGDFKNYHVKQACLAYEQNKVLINKINKLPSYAKASYYLKIIHKTDYIDGEGLNTIAFIESKPNITYSGNEEKTEISFEIGQDVIDRSESYYLNAYCVINENSTNYEYVSYNGLFIKGQKIEEVNVGLIWASVIIAGVIFLLILIRCIRYCYKTCCDYY